MLTELCKELRNWFDRGQPHLHGAFEIRDHAIVDADFNNAIQSGQYYLISGSVFNDGVHKQGDTLDQDEIFVGSVQLMAIPKEFIALSKDIDDWVAKYGGVDSAAMSPFSSESFGGYSYTKASGGSGGSGNNGSISWKDVFAARLNMWRKI